MCDCVYGDYGVCDGLLVNCVGVCATGLVNWQDDLQFIPSKLSPINVSTDGQKIKNTIFINFENKSFFFVSVEMDWSMKIELVK